MITITSTVAKKCGLPGFGSVSFGVTLTNELTSTDDINAEVARTYALLLEAVDREIQNPGFVPPPDFGMESDLTGESSSNGHSPNGDRWRCSPAQEGLIRKLVDEHSLDKDEVDHLARQRFGKGVKQLNKMEASGLIDELIDTHGKRSSNGSNGNRRNAYRGNGRRASAS